MRKTESTTKKNIWNVRMITNNVETYNKDFPTIKNIADDLGMTYAQVSELGKNGRTKRKQIRFKFYPDIQITRIGLTQREFYNQKRLDKAKKLLEKSEVIPTSE